MVWGLATRFRALSLLFFTVCSRDFRGMCPSVDLRGQHPHGVEY